MPIARWAGLHFSTGWRDFIFKNVSAVPFVKFYPSDWLSEESLRLISFAARGLWIDLLCLMAKSERRGYLTVNGGVNPSLAQLARLVGSTEGEIVPLLDELKQAGTCSIEAETGIIYSRRMVRDSAAYAQAVAFGLTGGNPRLRNRGVKGRVKGRVEKSEQPSLGSGFCASTISDQGSAEGGIPDWLKEPWKRWVGYKRERRENYAPAGEKAQISRLEKMGRDRALAAIDYSMAQNWAGIFEEKRANGNGVHAPPTKDRVPENLRTKPPIGTPVPQQTFL